MHYSGYIDCDTVNGDGIRCTLFVSGCSRGCQGCFNKETWDYRYGDEYTVEFEDKVLKDLASPYISGLSILGGNPIENKNFETVLKLCQRVKKELPQKDIWVWAGQTLKDIKNSLIFSQILDTVDVVIDGPFIEELKDTKLKFRGSSNQKINYKNVDF
jgi:anaerobic ribonucleoside-triphosphate reductase activating protein